MWSAFSTIEKHSQRTKCLNTHRKMKARCFAKPLYGLTPVPRVRIPSGQMIAKPVSITSLVVNPAVACRRRLNLRTQSHNFCSSVSLTVIQYGVSEAAGLNHTVLDPVIDHIRIDSEAPPLVGPSTPQDA